MAFSITNLLTRYAFVDLCNTNECICGYYLNSGYRLMRQTRLLGGLQRLGERGKSRRGVFVLSMHTPDRSRGLVKWKVKSRVRLRSTNDNGAHCAQIAVLYRSTKGQSLGEGRSAS